MSKLEAISLSYPAASKIQMMAKARIGLRMLAFGKVAYKK
jgi:hypothetical protein